MEIFIFHFKFYSSIFEFIVVPFLEITIWENYFLLTFVLIGIANIIYIRHNQTFTDHINNNNNNAFNQSIGDNFNVIHKNESIYCYNPWICSYIYYKQIKFYIISLISIVCALIFGIYLNVTTICHTNLKFNFFLVPDDCSEIYFDTRYIFFIQIENF